MFNVVNLVLTVLWHCPSDASDKSSVVPYRPAGTFWFLLVAAVHTKIPHLFRGRVSSCGGLLYHSFTTYVHDGVFCDHCQLNI